MRNVETVQANLSVRTATVARFEALKAFIPLVDMPQLQVGMSRVTGPVGRHSIRHLSRHQPWHAVSQPAWARQRRAQSVQHFPATRSIRTHHRPADRRGRNPRKELMEQVVRRAQAVLAAQRYFEAKQIGYGQRVADAGAYVT